MKRHTCLYSCETIQQLTKAQWVGSQSAAPLVVDPVARRLRLELGDAGDHVRVYNTVSSEVSSRVWG
jgi:hypothetical protein